MDGFALDTSAAKSVYVLTRTTYQWDWNCYGTLDADVFLAVFSSEESARRYCVDELGMKIVMRDKNGNLTLEPTRPLDYEYMPFEFEDDEFRDEYHLVKHVMR